MNNHDVIRFRATHNLSIEELIPILEIKISPKTVSGYETGRNPMPKYFRQAMEQAIELFGIDEKIPHNLDKYKKKGYERIVNQPYKRREVFIEQTAELPPASNHYNAGKSDAIDPITFGLANFGLEENLGFYRLNAIKYVARFGKKDGFNLDDLDKAIYYINKMKEVTKL